LLGKQFQYFTRFHQEVLKDLVIRVYAHPVSPLKIKEDTVLWTPIDFKTLFMPLNSI